MLRAESLSLFSGLFYLPIPTFQYLVASWRKCCTKLALLLCGLKRSTVSMPPKQKGKSAAKRGVKDAPVKLDDKDLLRRAEIEVACLQGLLEVKSQEVGL